MRSFNQDRAICGERGETILGVLVALMLSSIIMAAAVTNFSDAWRRSSDLRMMVQTETEARTVLDLMAYDLRMLGTGMPLGQSDFQIDATGLGTAVLPIMTSATTTSLAFRINETGTSTVVSSNYTPSSSSLTVSVMSTADFLPGDTVYLSNVTTGGTGGMQATIVSMTGTTLTFGSSFVASPGAVFKSGSIVERSTLVTYSSPANGTGITRNTGGGAVTLSPRSTFTLTFLQSDGTALTLPLTAATIKANLAAVQLNATVTSPHNLQSGQPFTATSQQTVALRNLNFNR